MEDYTLTFLGKDSGFGKNNNSAYIETENTLTLIDCGFTVFEAIKEKFDFKKYKTINVIITHLHNDHAGSLSQVILYMWFIFNKKINAISKCENIKAYLNITGTPEEAYDLYESIEGLKFIKTEHTPYLDAYGFAWNINGKKIIYTGDTNTLEPFKNYLDDANELYVDISKFGGAHLKIDDEVDNLIKIREKGTVIVPMHMDDREYIENKFKGVKKLK